MTQDTALKASIWRPETLKSYNSRKRVDLKIAGSLNLLIFSEVYAVSYVQKLVLVILLN